MSNDSGPPDPPDLSEQTVLIVDDEPANLGVLSEYLEGWRCKVLIARDGRSGLERARLAQPDLILLDVVMPDIDGIEVCRRLKADPATLHIPVIFMTVLTRTEDKVRGFQAGGVDFITKPFQHEEVLARIVTHLRLRALNAELEEAKKNLEQRVVQRTTELLQVNAELQTEIVERRQAEAALAAERNMLRTLIDNLPDYIYVKDIASRFVIGNIAETQLVGVAAPDDLVGRTDFDFFPAELAERYYADEQALLQSGQPLIDREEPVLDHLTGEQRWLSTTKVPLRDRQGQIVGMVGMGRDISDRKRLEAQLRQAQKMEAIGRLAGGIAHDFNNLLTAILGYADLALAELDTSSALRSEIEAIYAAGERAAALTKQLLAFSRQQVLQPQLLNLNTVLADLSQLLHRLLGEDIELLTLPSPDLGLVQADPSQLEQVILNLAVNARDAMPEGGRLTIETANVELDAAYTSKHVGVRPGMYVLLAVSDTGHGIDAETQAHLFEPFFTTKEVGKGTGLGLAMIHGIVNQSGGHIWVYSEVGHGSTFKIYLPQAVERQLTPRPRPIVTSAPQGIETILLVEDDALVRALARKVLHQYGYVVLEATSGVEAPQVTQAHRGRIDLVITDVILPGGMSGPQLIQHLLAQRPNLKVLFISGYTDNAVVYHKVLDAGLAFLQKPFTPETLARKVREVLDTPDHGSDTACD